MPVQVTALPEHPPDRLLPHVGRLGNGMFSSCLRLVPLRPNLEDFDALIRNTEAEVELASDFCRWATRFNEARTIRSQRFFSNSLRAIGRLPVLRLSGVWDPIRLPASP